MKKILKRKNKGFTLIELIVAMFILVMVMGAMVAVAVSVFQSYQKSRAIKTVTEDVGFALNSIAKDVRMGRIESVDSPSALSPSLKITRNSDMTTVCYLLVLANNYLAVSNSLPSGTTTCPTYSSTVYKKIVDLTGTDMTFDATSGFRNQKTNTLTDPKIRGWVEINLNIDSPSMAMDSIHVQTIISSRDYGWEETAL